MEVSLIVYLLLSLMLLSLITAGLPLSNAQLPEQNKDNIVLRAEPYVASLGTELEDWCGVTFEFLPDGRIICGELRSGKVRLIENGTIKPEPMIDLDVFSGWKNPQVIDEQGLVGLAIDPNFKSNGYVYVDYIHTVLGEGNTTTTAKRISRFTMVNEKLVDEKVLIDGIPAAKQHVGGPIEFGPDGKLYITGGEAGRQKEAQNADSLLGKILRLNPDGTIPNDNPDPASAVYTKGHRNVFGIAFHPITGRAFITENGNNTNDEINVLFPGGNYGWPLVNGTTGDPKYIDPIYATGNITIAPTEAEFYVGDKYPKDFVNDFFFLSYNLRSVDRIKLADDNEHIRPGVSVISYNLPWKFPSYTDIELGPDGYFYISDFQSIYRLIFERTNVTSSITLSGPSTGQALQPVTITAKMLDDNNQPVPNAPLDFLANGEKIAIGQVITNSEGVASASYTPLAGGTVTLMAKFNGNEKFAPSASSGFSLQVDGPKFPPFTLESTSSDNLQVMMTVFPIGDGSNNSTMRFAIKILDPRTQSEIIGIPYHLEIVRGGNILYAKDLVTSDTLNLQEYVFEETGSAEVVVNNINNRESGVSFAINIVPEFPVLFALVPLAAFALALTLARFGKFRGGLPGSFVD